MGVGGHRWEARAVGLAMLAAIGLAACAAVGLPSADTTPGPRTSRSDSPSPVVVDHVVDGDTLDVRTGGGHFERVRTVGIDAPESSSTRFGRPDACGPPSKAYAETLAQPGATVWLEASGRDRTDQYGRLLRLVHLGRASGTTWQERMVRAGWAEVFVYRGNTTRLLARLEVDQAHAKADSVGVYARCGGRFHDTGG